MLCKSLFPPMLLLPIRSALIGLLCISLSLCPVKTSRMARLEKSCAMPRSRSYLTHASLAQVGPYICKPAKNPSIS
ncbi:uncharacterized protein UTRI_06081 [Ustilago trichophora]|uniref:Uncharacterized protein n=1 Tax=Ustilago trichophora TaxID=86804 RepID=A0A5C3EFC7_9BASI|nr:uncharacterized protein UTRI_06081 [Ustilago trichophora]